MNKSELIEALANKQPHLSLKDVDLAVNCIIEHMCQALIANDRIEVRGFGSFSPHYHPARVGRNPKTGEPLNLPAKYSPHFKPGTELRNRVDESRRALCAGLEKGDSLITTESENYLL
ncbi:MAG: integration host factor subunit beta [Methylococcales bacterium]|nr:integration host factor subunit beta [Methylococcales bacterium]